MYTIDFNPHKGGYRVPEKVFQNVKALVLLNRECERCKTVVTPTNPHIALNVCLNCFLDREGKNYTFIGSETLRTSDHETFNFLGPDGYIFQTDSTDNTVGLGDIRERCIPKTLQWWGFPKISQTTLPNGKESRGYTVSIIGDFQTSQVVLVYYYPRSDRNNPDYYFLVYKSGEIMEFDKRRGETLKLWRAAKANVEATKDDEDYYHHPDDENWKLRQIQDTWIYREVVKLANAQVIANQKAILNGTDRYLDQE